MSRDIARENALQIAKSNHVTWAAVAKSLTRDAAKAPLTHLPDAAAYAVSERDYFAQCVSELEALLVTHAAAQTE